MAGWDGSTEMESGELQVGWVDPELRAHPAEEVPPDSLVVVIRERLGRQHGTAGLAAQVPRPNLSAGTNDRGCGAQLGTEALPGDDLDQSRCGRRLCERIRHPSLCRDLEPRRDPRRALGHAEGPILCEHRDRRLPPHLPVLVRRRR